MRHAVAGRSHVSCRRGDAAAARTERGAARAAGSAGGLELVDAASCPEGAAGRALEKACLGELHAVDGSFVGVRIECFHADWPPAHGLRR